MRYKETGCKIGGPLTPDEWAEYNVEKQPSAERKKKTPLPKKTSTPLKSTQEKLHSSVQKEMLSGKNVPKKPKKK